MSNNNTINYELYLSSKNYIDKHGYLSYWEKMHSFYTGRQHTKNDQGVPRAMTNICRLDVESKASKICGTPFALNFTCFDNTKSTIDLQKFDKYQQKRLKEENFNYYACCNGLDYGTEITYLRWDEDDTTIEGLFEGGLVQEHIDIRKFRVANPSISDIQKQKWVMFWNEEEVKAVRDICEIKENVKFIIPNGVNFEENNDISQSELEHKVVTVYTRFFRIDGEVYYQMSTKDVDITKPRPLNPHIEPEKLKVKPSDDDLSSVDDYDLDPQDAMINIIPKKQTKEKYKKAKFKFNYYPFAVYRPRKENNRFYGKSDVEEIIPNQKIINFVDSMVALDSQNTGWSKYIIKKGALVGQKINNTPGQVLVDNAPANVNGIRRLEGTPMNTAIISYAESLVQRTRNINGINEVFTGESVSKNLSGYAIQLLQEQSNTTIEQSQRLFWDYCIDKAYIRLLFYRFYFENILYVSELSEDEYQIEEQNRIRAVIQDKQNGIPLDKGNYPPIERRQVKEFDPNIIKENAFDISIEAGRGIKYSEIVVADMVNTLFINGNFQNMDTHHLEAYMKLNPLIPESTKSDFKVLIDKQKRDEISGLQTQLQQAVSQIQQLTNYTQQLETKLGVSSEYTKNLEKEFTNKINAQNDIIKAQNQAIKGQNNIPQASNYTE